MSLKPGDNEDPSSRLGGEGALQAAIDRIDGKIENIEDEIQRVDRQLKVLSDEIGRRDKTTRSELHERIDALKKRVKGREEAKGLITNQREVEETRATQEEDISRPPKFKEWAKENVVGLSGLAIGTQVL